jgi:8-oxo-dGTP diphosphatase
VKEFFDQNGNKVELSFTQGAFEAEAKHVLVICKYGDKWVLTQHKVRGLEFPGGKCEPGETLEEAARREVSEETGAVLDSLTWFGEYKVTDKKGSFIKAIFFAHVLKVEGSNTYYETNGPVIVEGDLLNMRFDKEFSFIMKDQVMEECLEFLQKNSGLMN